MLVPLFLIFVWMPNFQTFDTLENCCNGTMGYVTDQPDKMPCADMRCCNRSEIPAVFPVNTAYNFVFICSPMSRFLAGTCYSNSQVVFSTDTFVMEYTPRVCCRKNRFQIQVNTNDTALSILCVPTE